MNEILTTLNQYLQAASSTISKYGPQVWDASLHLIRIQNIFYLSLFILTAIAWVILAVILKRLKKQLKPPKLTAYGGWDTQDQTILQYVLLSITGTIWVIVFFVNVLSMYFGIFEPKLYILYHLAEKAGVL